MPDEDEQQEADAAGGADAAAAEGDAEEADDVRLVDCYEFTPETLSQDGRPGAQALLRYIRDHEGCSADDLKDHIGLQYFHETAKASSRRTRAYNIINALRRLSILTPGPEIALAEYGKHICAAVDDEAEFKARIASQIITKGHGLEVLLACKSILERCEPLTKSTIAEELSSTFEISTNRAPAAISRILQWAAAACVVRRSGDRVVSVEDDVLARLVGHGLADVREWLALTVPQRCFLLSLRTMARGRETDEFPVKHVIDTAIRTYGRILRNDDRIRAEITRPLEADGWIQLRTGAARSGSVVALPKLVEINESLLGAVTDSLPADVRQQRNRPLADLFAELRSEDKHVKGLALEGLAVRMAADMGLLPYKLRMRGIRTGGAEVDLIAERIGIGYSRWMFQCKNTDAVDADVVAKEIGLALLTKAHVVVVVTTGEFRSSVPTLVRRASQESALQVLLIDGTGLAGYLEHGPVWLLRQLHTQTKAIRLQKSGQLEDVDDLA